MEVLLFSSAPTYPVQPEASARVGSIGTRLMDLGHRVHLVYCDLLSPITPEQVSGMRSQWTSFHYIPHQSSKRRSKIDHILDVDEWLQADGGVHISKISSVVSPDVVICDYRFSSNFFDYVSDSAIRIIDTRGVFLGGTTILDELDLSRKIYSTSRDRVVRQLRRADVLLSMDDEGAGFFQGSVNTPAFAVHLSGQCSRFDSLFRSKEALIESIGGLAAIADARNRQSRNVVIVTHARFWTGGLGSLVRIRQLVEELSRIYRVTVFVTFQLNENDLEQIFDLKLPIEVVGTASKQAFSGENTSDNLLGKSINQEVLRDFQELVDRLTPNVCIVEYLRLRFLLAALPKHCLRIIDTLDLISIRQDSQFESRKVVDQGRKIATVRRQDEMQALADFDYLMMIQRSELAIVDTWGFERRALYVPVHFGALERPARAGSGEVKVGFIGAPTDANYDGLKWFLEEVWPFFVSRPVRLVVAGGICQRFQSGVDGVDWIGPTNIDDFYDEIDIAVNSAQWGGGLKIKTVEALARGVPVVATPDGASGVEEADGSGLAIAPNAALFAKAINDLIKSPDRRREQGQAAYRYAADEFDRRRTFADLHAIIQSSSPAWAQRGKLAG